MIPVKQVRISDHDENGHIIGTKKVVVKWICPTCKEAMGEPFSVNLVSEDNAVYPVDLWENPCGHQVHKKDLLILPKKITSGGPDGNHKRAT